MCVGSLDANEQTFSVCKSHLLRKKRKKVTKETVTNILSRRSGLQKWNLCSCVPWNKDQNRLHDEPQRIEASGFHVQKFLQIPTGNSKTEFHIPRDRGPGPAASERIPSASVGIFGVLLLKIPKNKKKYTTELYLFARNCSGSKANGGLLSYSMSPLIFHLGECPQQIYVSEQQLEWGWEQWQYSNPTRSIQITISTTAQTIGELTSLIFPLLLAQIL